MLTLFTKYLQYLRQVIPALNSPSDIDNYECKSDDVKLIKPLCNLTTAEFNPIQDGGEQKATPPISYSPVTSTNVGISPQNFLM